LGSEHRAPQVMPHAVCNPRPANLYTVRV